MKEIDFIFNAKTDLQTYALSVPYRQDDIRREFYALLYDTYNNYYLGYVTFILSKEIESGNIKFDNKILYLRQHVSEFVGISSTGILTVSFISLINKRLLLDAWGSFELCLTVLAENILSDDEKEKMKSIELENVIKIIQEFELTNNQLEKLKKGLYKSHLSHVPLWRKFNSLCKVDNLINYDRNLKEDLEFIKFFGTMRNTMAHSNSIYYGQDFIFDFKGYIFSFHNGEVFRYQEDISLRPKLYIDLCDELINIYKAISIKFTKNLFISYPDTSKFWDETLLK